ncbi:MAG: type I methionyl aminopeptidase [candidate division KSB1 bacterium]|nr:type I methionyl aminopeptidase [candidate division KSB1 bacterium]
MIAVRSDKEIVKLRKSAQLVVDALNLAKTRITAGLETRELDEEIAELIYSRAARPAFKGFQGFPASSCISINEQVVHGIPGNRKIKNGDIVSVDVGVELDGYFGDAAKTFIVGNIPEEVQLLVQVTQESLGLAIEQAHVGNRLSDIGHAIQTHVEQAGFSVVRDLVGHGIGTQMHEEPQIKNYGPAGQGPRLKEGMVFAIEPMINLGTFEVETLDDGWTVVTADGKPSAHFEHDIVVKHDKAEILTAGL